MRHDSRPRPRRRAWIPLLVALPLPALADSPPQPGALEEVVVTAQRRSENLQVVPISITALTRDDLDHTGADRLWDLGGALPNVSLPGGFGRGPLAEIGIRGISTFVRNAGFESGVAVYLDGAYMGRSYGVNQPLPDIERIEVLRGPQGTLFGRNTSAGAINITSRAPSSTPGGQVSADVGNYGLWGVNGYVTGPLAGPEFLGKLAGFVRQRDGYMKNLFNGRSVDSEDTGGLRGELDWSATEDTHVRFAADYTRYRPVAAYNDVVGGPAAAYAPRPREVALNGGFKDAMNLYGGSITVTHATPSRGEWTSITGLRRQSEDVDYDDDVQPLDILRSFITDEARIFTQEFRYTSPIGSTVDFVAGAFYLDQSVRRETYETVKIVAPTDAFYVLGDVGTKSYALYAQGNWHVTTAATVFAGLRWTREDKDLVFQQDGIANLGLPSFARLTDSQSNDAWTPTLGIRYQLSDDALLYASVARGFKAGGWNTDLVTNLVIEFDPEYVTSYEAGAKTLMLDGRLRLNGAIFWMDYEDLQVQQFRVTSFETTNAGKATIKGAEFELAAALTSGLTLAANAGYTDAKYDRFDECYPGVSCAGKWLRNAPRWTAGSSLEYSVPVSTGAMLARAEVAYKSEAWFDAQNLPTAYVGSSTLINARIGWEGKQFSAYLWGKNLADREYLTNRQDLSIVGAVLGAYGAPRTWGGTLTYRF